MVHPLALTEPILSNPSFTPLQKLRKRTKAASDPSCPPKVTWTPSILQIDYMSSEYSSEGEPDNNSPAKMAPGLWDLISGGSMMSGMGESKVLEIRTPRWRSQDVSSRFLHPLFRLCVPSPRSG